MCTYDYVACCITPIANGKFIVFCLKYLSSMPTGIELANIEQEMNDFELKIEFNMYCIFELMIDHFVDLYAMIIVLFFLY